MKKTALLKIGASALAAGIMLSGCGARSNTSGSASGAEQSTGITDDSITIGASFPLSGTLVQFGEGQLGGLKAFLDKTNDAGGVQMADGKTRKIKLTYYDDAYDPARITQNFRRLSDQDKMFAFVGAFGTASNLAVLPIANELKTPQVFLASGASVFSADRKKNPWTIGFQPTYENEGTAFGKHLVASGKPRKVAFLGQNDDQGKAFLAGLENAIKDSDVKLVARATYEATDTSVDSQISQLAASGADAFMSAVAFPNLQAAGLKKMGELGWTPSTYLPIIASSAEGVVAASGADKRLPDLLTSAFLKQPCSPAVAQDPDVKEFTEAVAKYAPKANPCVPNTAMGYATGNTLVATLAGMKSPTREAFMQSISDLKTKDVALLLPGLSVNGGNTGQPPVSDLIVRKFANGGWTNIN